MDRPKVSVIIPAYNNETYIEKCLQSVTEQSYENLEILVINDGSSDRTEELIRKWQQADERIQLLTQINSGVSVSRNRGIDTATGTYLTFVDADDYIGKDYIRDLVNLAEEKNADL
ncbi:MAG: glycosyltransferase family 2 protein, partial [Lachnospiraceae bacterium]|nr:glycosyltransferase family 2 protein [Lachnospiraceae bacterium]